MIDRRAPPNQRRPVLPLPSALPPPATSRLPRPVPVWEQLAGQRSGRRREDRSTEHSPKLGSSGGPLTALRRTRRNGRPSGELSRSNSQPHATTVLLVIPLAEAALHKARGARHEASPPSWHRSARPRRRNRQAFPGPRSRPASVPAVPRRHVRHSDSPVCQPARLVD